MDFNTIQTYSADIFIAFVVVVGGGIILVSYLRSLLRRWRRKPEIPDMKKPPTSTDYVIAIAASVAIPLLVLIGAIADKVFDLP